MQIVSECVHGTDLSAPCATCEDADTEASAFEKTAVALEAQAADLKESEDIFNEHKELSGAFNRAAWWLGQAAKELRKLVQ